MKIPSEWTFDSEEVAGNFDAHVREQLPWYELATEIVCHIANHYIPKNGLVYDIGASNGNIGRSLKSVLDSRGAKLLAVEPSKEMVGTYSGPGTLINSKVEDIDIQPFDLAVCFLSLMFIEVRKRFEVVQSLRSNIRRGGAIVVFDKAEPSFGYPSIIMSRLSLCFKLKANASPKEIIEKELSLSGVQRPLSRSELGQDAVEVFRVGDFCGWIIEASNGPKS